MKVPKFAVVRRAFSMTCRVDVDIRAKREAIWSILVDAEGYSRWNSTIARLEGKISEGERLRLHVPGADRVFTPRVTGVAANVRMTWSDGLAAAFRGVRDFELTEGQEASTVFTMRERFSGLLFPLIGRLLPDFEPIFVAFAGDLKREAERNEQPDSK
jgi:hypothetical protein